jgi:predicted nucleotidyltransferase
MGGCMYNPFGTFDMIGILEKNRKQISEACARHGVVRLHIFGSALSADFRPDESDLDLLVEFVPMEPYARVDAYFGMLDELKTLLNTKIDLVMAGAVKNPYIAREIERTKEVFYAS